MTMECYNGACPKHSVNHGEEGPFCYEVECVQTPVYVWAQPAKRTYDDWALEEADIYASELVGPNSIEHEDCAERRYEELISTRKLPVDDRLSESQNAQLDFLINETAHLRNQS